MVQETCSTLGNVEGLAESAILKSDKAECLVIICHSKLFSPRNGWHTRGTLRVTCRLILGKVLI